MPGLMYIAAVLREAGHEVKLLEGAFHTQAQILAEIGTWKPQLFGVYSVALMWNRARDLLRSAKEVLPSVFTVAGGHGPTAFMEQCFESDGIDAVVFGEGELTAIELASRVAEGETLEGVRGCIWRRDGEIVVNPSREPIDDLDAIPFPAYDLVAHYPYRPSYGQVRQVPAVEMVSSRGCPNSCIYCFRIKGSAVRFRSAENVVDEMELYVRKYGAKEIKFWDEHFTLDRDRALAICEELLRRRLRVHFWCSARVDAVDPELLHMMKRAGCWCINFGLETGVEKNLATLNKETTVEQGIQAVEMTHRAGIQTVGTYVFGIPGETYQEGLETIRLACRLNHYYVEFFPLTPFPGTELYENVAEYGRLNASLDRMGMLFKAAPFVPYSMTEEEIVALLDKAFTTYYSRPSFVLRRIAGIRTWYDAQAIINGGIAIVNMVLRRVKRRYA